MWIEWGHYMCKTLQYSGNLQSCLVNPQSWEKTLQSCLGSLQSRQSCHLWGMLQRATSVRPIDAGYIQCLMPLSANPSIVHQRLLPLITFCQPDHCALCQP